MARQILSHLILAEVEIILTTQLLKLDETDTFLKCKVADE